MKPMEIRDKLMAGELTPQQAKQLFEESREKKTHHPPPAKMIHHEIQDRQALARVRGDLARHITQTDAKHYYDRVMLEEKTRHGIALIAYGLIGMADGVLDSAGYAISELAEDMAFTVSRTYYRVKDGWQRGKL